MNGLREISNILFNLDISNTTITNCLLLPNNINKNKNKSILSKYISLIIYKIIQKKYPDNIKYFDLDDKIKSNKAYHTFIDKYNDWIDNLETIFYLVSINYNNKDIDIWKEYLYSDDIKNHMLFIENILTNYIKKMGKIKNIELNKLYIYDNKNLFIDILIDDTLITLNTSNNQTTTINNICENLIKIYLLNKNGNEINKLVLFNPILCDLDEINIDNNLENLYKIFYN